VFALKVPVSSLDDFILSLKSQLVITSGISLNYFDPDLDLFVVLKNIEDLPAEKAKVKIVAHSLNWWGWAIDSTWIERGYETTRYYSLLVKEGTKVHHAVALEKFKAAAANMGFDGDQVYKVFAISNPKLMTNFDNYRDMIQAKHRANPGLFRKTDWNTMDEAAKRARQLQWFDSRCARWSWNDHTKPNSVPMIQGTTEAAAWQICQQGFGVVATTDDGYYGRGVYFTTKITYASTYAKAGEDGKVFLLSVVVPGNIFPITEHPFLNDGSDNPAGYKGKACRVGYQSHLTLVDERNPSVAFSPDATMDAPSVADELVIFEAAQAVPVFVFYLK
jgi:hypothetical protein